jgi:hypothetical protein
MSNSDVKYTIKNPYAEVASLMGNEENHYRPIFILIPHTAMQTKQ